MNIRYEDSVMIMSESLVCKNYSDMNHYNSNFQKVGDNEYKCTHCDTVMVVKEPVLVYDDKGRVKMQIETESKPFDPPRIPTKPGKSGTPLKK